MRLQQTNMARKTVALFLIVITGLAVGIIMVLSGTKTDQPSLAEPSAKPRNIAHRGGALLWPENTLYAFERAVALEVDMIEMDIHASADGHLVVIHDDTVGRTTNGTGRVGDFSLEEIQSLDAGYHFSPDGTAFPHRGKGLRIPALREVLERFRSVPLLIEMKHALPPMEDDLCGLIEEFGAEDRVIVASFHHEALVRFRQRCPSVPTSASRQEARRFVMAQRTGTARILRPRAAYLQLPEYAEGRLLLTASLIRAANATFAEVHAWTINDEEAMRRLIELGVDGIVTDRPDLLKALLEE